MVAFFAQIKDLHSFKHDFVTFRSGPPGRTYERRYPATLTQLIPSQVDWPLRQLELRVFEISASAFIAVIRKYRITLKNLGFSDVCLTGSGDSWLKLLPSIRELLTLETASLYQLLEARDSNMKITEAWFAHETEGGFPRQFNGRRAKLENYLVHGRPMPLKPTEMFRDEENLQLFF